MPYPPVIQKMALYAYRVRSGKSFACNLQALSQITHCGDWCELEKSVEFMIGRGLIRLYKWQDVSGSYRREQIGPERVHSVIFFGYFEIEPLPALQRVYSSCCGTATLNEER